MTKKSLIEQIKALTPEEKQTLQQMLTPETKIEKDPKEVSEKEIKKDLKKDPKEDPKKDPQKASKKIIMDPQEFESKVEALVQARLDAAKAEKEKKDPYDFTPMFENDTPPKSWREIKLNSAK